MRLGCKKGERRRLGSRLKRVTGEKEKRKWLSTPHTQGYQANYHMSRY